jgi:hypothetical protein
MKVRGPVFDGDFQQIVDVHELAQNSESNVAPSQQLPGRLYRESAVLPPIRRHGRRLLENAKAMPGQRAVGNRQSLLLQAAYCPLPAA